MRCLREGLEGPRSILWALLLQEGASPGSGWGCARPALPEREGGLLCPAVPRSAALSSCPSLHTAPSLQASTEPSQGLAREGGSCLCLWDPLVGAWPLVDTEALGTETPCSRGQTWQ